MGTCALCKGDSELQKSHIIPKFVFKWLKDTSATGLMRQAVNPQKPIQDGETKRMLCKECEKKFSKFETSFANNIFYPYQKEKTINFQIDKNIINFAISISWRIASKSLSGFKEFQPSMFPHLENAINYWNTILNEGKEDEYFEHHILFLDILNQPHGNLEKFNFYMLRCIDSTIVADSNEVFCFTKFPGMFIISLIYPNKNIENKNTKLSMGENIIGPQTYVHAHFDEFLQHRVQEAFKHKLSDRQQQKLTERILKNKERALSSESFRVKFNN
jgi:hypothetical protein